MGRRHIITVLVTTAGLLGCAPSRTWHARSNGAPTCEAVCDYYTSCRKTNQPTIHGACVAECSDIFYEDGKPDESSLRQFQRLECSDAIAFVEGKNGRPPGTHGPQTSIQGEQR